MNLKDFVDRVESITKKRMLESEVVDLKDFRSLKFQKNKPSLLIIDDEEIVRNSIKRALEKENYKILTASDASELKEIASVDQLDLIILDVELPWMNGFELAEILQSHADLKEIPIVFISGSQDKVDVKKAFASGASDFIQKPLDLNYLKKTVRSLLFLTREF